MSGSDTKRLRWQCRRGLLELDVIFNDFLNQGYEQLSDPEKKLFETLLQESDPQLLAWALGKEHALDPKFNVLRGFLVASLSHA